MSEFLNNIVVMGCLFGSMAVIALALDLAIWLWNLIDRSRASQVRRLV